MFVCVVSFFLNNLEVPHYRECDYFFLHEATRTVPHCHYFQLVVSLLIFHFYLHLLRLSSLHIFAAYVTTIYAKFNFLISFSVCSSTSLSSASTLFVLSSSAFLLFQYVMIEAKLVNELGFLCALIMHSCHLFLW